MVELVTQYDDPVAGSVVNDRVAGAGRYERSPVRQDTRAGSYQRKLQTKADQVTLTVPRLARGFDRRLLLEVIEALESSTGAAS